MQPDNIGEHNSLAIAYNKLYKRWELSGKKNKAFSNRLVIMWKRIQELQKIIHEPKGQPQL